ncbi:MAG: hypothetical protein AAF408_04770 [Pseudomonadota bacterium]
MNWTDTHRRRWLAWLLAGLLTGLCFASLVYSADPSRTEGLMFGLWRLRHVAVAGFLLLAAVAFLCLALGRSAWLAFWSAALPVGLFCIALEGAGRLGLINWDAMLTPRNTQEQSVGWSLRPNISVQGITAQDIASRYNMPQDPIHFEFATDQYGFRNGADTDAQIILLGDSIVLGAAVAPDQTVAEVVQDRAEVQAMQAALLGLSVQAQHDMLLSSGLPLDGKKVVQFLFEGNDLLDSNAYMAQLTASSDAGNESADKVSSSLGKLLWSKLVDLSNPPENYNSCQIGPQTYLFLWTRRSFQGVESEFDNIVRSILEFRSKLRQAGAEYALVFVPSKYRVLHDICLFPADSAISDPQDILTVLPQQVQRFAEENGIGFLDLTAALKSTSKSGDIPWFWGDTHWNAIGHETAGREIAGWLRTLGL